MNLKQVFVGALFAAGVSMASAMTTIDYGAYVLDPDGHNIEAVCHEVE